MTKPRSRNMASLSAVVDYWMPRAAEVFSPTLSGYVNGWGEPFCFRCNWLSPLPAEITRDQWEYAGGWLHRAHLTAHADGGSGKPENLVPLCWLCHSIQPEGLDRDDVIAWIRSGPHCDWLWQTRTEALFGGDNFRDFPGERAMHKLRAQFSEWAEEHYHRPLRELRALAA